MSKVNLASAATLRTPADLVAHGFASAADLPDLEKVAARYAVAITADMAALIDAGDPDDPIARQFIPNAEELVIRASESADPIGDHAFSPVAGIVHRYPDRVLFKLVHVCAVYCRFCFRREMVGPGKATALSPAAYRGADSESREPRAIGSIESTAGGMATIDLGSVDGLAKDAEVDVVRGGEAIGKIRLTTIFRDHSRGDIMGALQARARDQVRVPPLARLRANLDQIEAAIASGETEKATSIARQASVEGIHADLSRAEDWNNAGVIAELHGDRVKALEFYQRASQSAPSEEDRQAIEKNLRRMRGGK